MKLLVSLTLLLLLPQAAPVTGDGTKQGRQGNALYNQEQYQGASDAFATGLASYQDVSIDGAYYGLQNNLGAALHKQEDFERAQAAFAKALETASTEADFARASYNAGNNAFSSEQAEAALDHYKKALLANPSNLDAKFNYEFVKRKLEEEQQQQQQQGGDDQEQNDEQNQDQQDQQNDQQNQDQNQQNQDQNQQNDQQQDQQQQQPQPDQQLSRQQAERILQALENEEEQLLREVQKMKGRPRRVEKDW